MHQTFLNNTANRVKYVLLWILYTILETTALYSILKLPFSILIIDCFYHALTFGTIGILLWTIINYGNYAVLTAYQRLLNYTALALLTIVIWLGLGFMLTSWTFDNQYAVEFISIVPLRALSGVLIYLLIIQQFQNNYQQNENKFEDIELSNLSSENLLEKRDEIELTDRIAIKTGTKIHVILIPEIVYIQADGDYVQIHTINGKHLKEQTMKYFEMHLSKNQFVRVHRSTIVNIEQISRIELYEKQNQLLTLKNGHQVKTSPSGYKTLRMALKL